MPRYQLTIEADTLAELLEQLADAKARAVLGQVDQLAAAEQRASVPGAVVVCTGGHGAMRLVAAGIAKSGPRIGQPYPAFWKCDVCGERRDQQ